MPNDHWDLLFPPGEQETDSNLFDITLIVLLIKTCIKLTPVNGWKGYVPAATNHSLPADVIRVLEKSIATLFKYLKNGQE